MKHVLFLAGACSAQQVIKEKLDILPESPFPESDMNTPVSGDPSRPGIVKWSQCKDDAEIFKFWAEDTFVTPSPITENTELLFGLRGEVSKAIQEVDMDVTISRAGKQVDEVNLPRRTPREVSSWYMENVPFMVKHEYGVPGNFTIRFVAKGFFKDNPQ